MADRNYPKYTGPEMSLNSDKMTKEEIKNRFDNETAELYSQRKPLWLPEFEFSFALIQKVLKPFIHTETRIVDLGAGTGNLSRTILESYPDIKIDLVDFSANMLKEVDKVLSGFQGKYETIKGDIFNIDLKTNTYNCAVSSFAIHHARGEDVYKNLYSNIFNSLTESGIFVCCDVIDGANDYLSEFNENGWSDFLLANGFNNKDIDKIINNYHREDSPLSISTHFKLLSEVGFKTVDILWKKYNFAIYLGIK